MKRLELGFLGGAGTLKVIDRLLNQLHGVVGGEEALAGAVDGELATNLLLLDLFSVLLHLGDEAAVLVVLHAHDRQLLGIIYELLFHVLLDE